MKSPGQLYRLHLDAGSISLSESHFLIASPWDLSGLLPSGLEIVGEAYEITISDNMTGLVKLVLRLRYDPTASAVFENFSD